MIIIKHDSYVETKGTKECIDITVNKDVQVDEKHIISNEHSVKVTINDDSTIMGEIDINDDDV